MGIIGAFKRLLGLLCVGAAAMLGSFAIFGYFADNNPGSHTTAAVIGGLALLVLVIGLRCLGNRRAIGGAAMIHYECEKCREKMESPSCMAGKREVCPSCGFDNKVPKRSPEKSGGYENRSMQEATAGGPAVRLSAIDGAQQEWEDPALVQDDNAPWRPWMRKGRLYRAIRERRYIRVAYQKKDGEEPTTRILWPKKITAGRLRADDLTPGHTPGNKLFIVDRITFVELLPQEWTPIKLGR